MSVQYLMRTYNATLWRPATSAVVFLQTYGVGMYHTHLHPTPLPFMLLDTEYIHT